MGGLMAFEVFMAGEKQCLTCGKCKPAGEFHADKKRKDGRRPNCRECHNEMHRKGTGHRPWSAEEIRLVCRNYASVGAEGCHKLLCGERTLAAIQQLAFRYELTAPKYVKPEDSVELYPRDAEEAVADSALRNFKPCTPAANGPRYLIGAMG